MKKESTKSPYYSISVNAAKAILADVVGIGAPDPATYRKSEGEWLKADEREYKSDINRIAKIVLKAIEKAAKKVI